MRDAMAMTTLSRKPIERLRTRGDVPKSMHLIDSAAAAILSLGYGPRKAGRTTVLRHHFHRMPSEQELAAQKAREYPRPLSQIDRKMTWQIAERAHLELRSDEETPNAYGYPLTLPLLSLLPAESIILMQPSRIPPKPPSTHAAFPPIRCGHRLARRRRHKCEQAPLP